MSEPSAAYRRQTWPGRLTGRGTAWRALNRVQVLVDVAHADGRVTADVPGRADGFNGDQVCVTYWLDGEQFIRWFPAADVRRAMPSEDTRGAGIVAQAT